MPFSGPCYLARCDLWRVLYIAYTGTVVLTGKTSFLFYARCIFGDFDKEMKLFFLFVRCVIYRTMYAFHIYPNTLSYQVVIIFFIHL